MTFEHQDDIQRQLLFKYWLENKLKNGPAFTYLGGKSDWIVFNELYDHDSHFEFGPNSLRAKKVLAECAVGHEYSTPSTQSHENEAIRRSTARNTTPTPLKGGNKQNMEVTKVSKKYTAAQKRAYYSGMGYAACMEGKSIPFTNEENKASFKAGLDKGRAKVKNYPNRKGGSKNGNK